MTNSTEPTAGNGKLLRFIDNLERALLCLLLTGMICLSCLQIALRSFFSGGLLWADPLIQQLVLWTGLLGASMATAHSKHIALDLFTHLVPAKIQQWILVLTHLFSTLTVATLAYAACFFIASEIAYGGPGLFSLPSWIWNLVFPLTFILITLRSAIACIRQVKSIIGRQTEARQ